VRVLKRLLVASHTELLSVKLDVDTLSEETTVVSKTLATILIDVASPRKRESRLGNRLLAKSLGLLGNGVAISIDLRSLHRCLAPLLRASERHIHLLLNNLLSSLNIEIIKLLRKELDNLNGVRVKELGQAVLDSGSQGVGRHVSLSWFAVQVSKNGY
jgi:hypothetical protein